MRIIPVDKVNREVDKKLFGERRVKGHDKGAEFARRNVLKCIVAASMLNDEQALSVKRKAQVFYSSKFRCLGYTGNCIDICDMFAKDQKKDRELFSSFVKRPEVSSLGIITIEELGNYLRTHYSDESEHRFNMDMFDPNGKEYYKFADYDVSFITGVFGISRREGGLADSELRDCYVAFNADKVVESDKKVYYFKYKGDNLWGLDDLSQLKERGETEGAK